MKPVLILQNLGGDGPGYLGTWLARERIPSDVRNAEAGEPYPERIEGYAALALLGGEMSANDELDSLRQAEALILQAMARAIPVIGHCLGGQLMARALGARIGPSTLPEVGWQPLDVVDSPTARLWFGTGRRRTVFHWHTETFALPPGARLVAGSRACANQSFAIGPHLAMQFHVEVDDEKLGRWSASVDPAYVDLQRRHPETVQSGEQMRDGARQALREQQRLADRVYAQWFANSAV